MAKRKAARRSVRSKAVVLPVIGVLTVIAVAFGLHLGQSAVAQIDPLYHRGSAPIPRDVSSNARPALRSAYAEASSWEEGQRAMAQDCGADCPRMHARDLWDARPAAGQRVALPPPAVFADHSPEPALAAPSDPAPSPDRLNRYLHYPVSHDSDPAPSGPSVPDEAPTPPRGEPEGM